MTIGTSLSYPELSTQIWDATWRLFVVIDIIPSIPLLSRLHARGITLQPFYTTAMAGLFMLTFLLAGERLLDMLHLSKSAFQVAGAIILFIIGLEFILNIQIIQTDTSNSHRAAVVPLAFPIIAGMGTLTTLISLQERYSLLAISMAIAINLVITYLVLRYLTHIQRALGATIILIMQNLAAVLLLSMAIQTIKIHFLGLA